MTPPIPDQLRQWHAQFIAGDVLFSRIMADIDAAIACYVDPLTPEKVIELAQLCTLKVALYEAARQFSGGDLKQLVWLQRIDQALEVAELWRDNTSYYFQRLVTIYADVAVRQAAPLDTLFTLLDKILGSDGNMPSTVSAFITMLLAHGRFEEAWQCLRLQPRQLIELPDIVLQCLALDSVLAAQQYWQFFAHELPRRTDIPVIGARLAAVWHHAGYTAQARRCFQQAQALLQRLYNADEQVVQGWFIALEYLRIGDYQSAQALFAAPAEHVELSPAVRFDATLLDELMTGLAGSHPTIHAGLLLALYQQMDTLAQESMLGLAFARRLMTLGAAEEARFILRRLAGVARLWEQVLVDLAALEDTPTITAIVEHARREADIRINQTAQIADYADLARLLVAGSEIDKLDALLNQTPVWTLELRDALLNWVQRHMTSAHWAQTLLRIHAWTLQLHGQGELMLGGWLCGLAEISWTYDAEQARHWLDEALAIDAPDEFIQLQLYQRLIETLLKLKEYDRLEDFLRNWKHNAREFARFRLLLLDVQRQTANWQLLRLTRWMHVGHFSLPLHEKLTQPNPQPMQQDDPQQPLASYWNTPKLAPDGFAERLCMSQARLDRITPDLGTQVLRACLEVVEALRLLPEMPQ